MTRHPSPLARATVPRGSRRGSIIVPVLIILVLLAYVAAEVGRDLATDYGGAAYLKGALGSGWLLDDAEQHGVDLLLADLRRKSKADHYNEDWAAFGDDVALLQSADGPELSGAIEDMDGLFPISSLYSKNVPNQAERRQYDGIFVRLVGGLKDAYGVGEGDPKDLLEAIRSWMGDVTATRNDEQWYEDQPGSYEPPERELLYPAELLLVRWEDVEGDDFRKVMLGHGGGPGLVDLVTMWGSGKINMNTAPEPIVRAVSPDSGKAAAYWNKVSRYRASDKNDLSKRWYEDIAQSVKLSMDRFPADALDVSSTAFRIRVRARTGGTVRRQLAVVLRSLEGEAEIAFRQSY